VLGFTPTLGQSGVATGCVRYVFIIDIFFQIVLKKKLFMAYTRKTTFNIDGIIIFSSLFIPLNCKDLPSLNSE
jgi:hypothetical protein